MPTDPFSLNPEALAGIAVMAVVTFGLKLAGLFTQRLMRPGPAVTRFLEALPACVIISLTVPLALAGGVAGAVAAASVVPVIYKTGNIILGVACGYAAGMVVRVVVGL